MTQVADIQVLFRQLKDSFERGEYTKASQWLKSLRVALVSTGLLLSSREIPQEMTLLIRDSLELGAYLALYEHNMDHFQSIMLQLRAYYTPQLPQSQRQNALLGLDLLRCLVMHHSVEFHTLIETLPVETILHDPYIKHALVLEQYLMEGSFHKAKEACMTSLGPEYAYFMSCMLFSLRAELADCMERAYDCLEASAAMRLLFCSSEAELGQLIQEVCH